MPAITNPVLMDATTLGAYLGSPLIQIDGTNAGAGANGFLLKASGNVIKGIAITHFSGDGILLQSSNQNTIAQDFIGVDPSGILAEANNNGIEARRLEQQHHRQHSHRAGQRHFREYELRHPDG